MRFQISTSLLNHADLVRKVSVNFYALLRDRNDLKWSFVVDDFTVADSENVRRIRENGDLNREIFVRLNLPKTRFVT